LSAAAGAESAVHSQVETAFAAELVAGVGSAAAKAGFAAGRAGPEVATAVAVGGAVTVRLQVETAFAAMAGFAAGRIGSVVAFAAGPGSGIADSAVEALAG